MTITCRQWCPSVPTGKATPMPCFNCDEQLALLTPDLTALAPNTAVINTGVHVITVTGTDFTPSSVVIFNGAPVATTYVSPTQLTFSLNSVGAVAGPINVTVKTGTLSSAAKVFTYTAV